MKKRFIVFMITGTLLLLSGLIIISFDASLHLIEKNKRTPKVLVLIAATDDKPVYNKFHRLWRQYKDIDPEHIEVYFLRADPELPVACRIDGDVIWARTTENQIPGATDKTIAALELLWPRIKKEFDFVLRTTLSSFIVFPRMLSYLKACPQERYYGGSTLFIREWLDNGVFCYDSGCDYPSSKDVVGRLGVLNYGSGSGFIISRDLVKMILDHKQELFNNTSTYDDVLFGQFFRNYGIAITPFDRRNFVRIDDWHESKDSIPEDIFHFRIKHPEAVRSIYDIYVYSELLAMFYPSRAII